MSRRRWTVEEDQVIISQVKSEPYNLTKCFMAVSTKIDRTPNSIKVRWYSSICKNKDYASYLTCGKEGKYVVNRKNSYASLPLEVQHLPKSRWITRVINKLLGK